MAVSMRILVRLSGLIALALWRIVVSWGNIPLKIVDFESTSIYLSQDFCHCYLCSRKHQSIILIHFYSFPIPRTRIEIITNYGSSIYWRLCACLARGKFFHSVSSNMLLHSSKSLTTYRQSCTFSNSGSFGSQLTISRLRKASELALSCQAQSPKSKHNTSV